MEEENNEQIVKKEVTENGTKTIITPISKMIIPYSKFNEYSFAPFLVIYLYIAYNKGRKGVIP